jgi:hypothetical protein
MFQKLNQIKDMRKQAKDVQSVLADVTVHADAVGGKVGVVMDGNQKILSIDIDESLLSPENKKKIEDGVKDAIASAMKKLQREMMMKMKSGDLEMPDMSNLT